MTILEHARQLVQPASRRYRRYDARFRVFGKALGILRRHRVMVAFIAGLLLVLILAFLSVMGSFFSEASCQDAVYGEPILCDAKAFLTSSKLQFSGMEGTAQWTAAPPSFPGQHRVRAVSKNGYGFSKYSNEMTFTLLPRDLEISLPQDSILYGEESDAYFLEHAQITGLAEGDRITEAKWDAQQTEGPALLVQLNSLRIEDPLGRDVTACYRVTAKESRLTVQPRPVTVSVSNATKLYDGLPFKDITTMITSGTLAAGDQLVVSFSGTPADAGTYPLAPEYAVRNPAGADVTHQYAITAVSGMLTVQPIPLTIQTGSAEKVYDGQPLTCSEWDLTEGAVLEGHILQVSLSAAQTVVGKTNNTPVITVLDAEGKDVSGNYKPVISSGTLTVTPIMLKFATDSAEKVYDGNPLRSSSWHHVEGRLLPGHSLRANTEGEQLLAGFSENSLSVKVTDNNGRDVTAEGYEIQVDSGLLTVHRRPIILTSRSAEKLFDGTPLICHAYDITEGSIAQQEGVYWHDFTGSQTSVGSSSNTFSVKISSGRQGGKDVTSSYDIRYDYGTLTVKPNPAPPDDPSGGTTSPGNDGPSGGISIPGVPPLGAGIEIGFPVGSNETVYATVYCVEGFGTRQVYFRSGSYGNYTGSGWTAPKLYESETFSPLWFAGEAVGKKFDSQALVIELENECPILLPYYSIMASEIGTGVPYNDCYFTYGINGNNTYGVPCMPDPDFADLRFLSLMGDYAEYELMYRDHVYENYLDVPELTRMALMDWAAGQGIQPDSPTLITDIQTAVQNGAYYSQHSGTYPPGVDVAVHFLTAAKEGVCQHFATAATLLYRCYGIPARYTTGFLTTVYEGTGTTIVGNDAHAWVEIYQDGLGWVHVEVTGSNVSPDDMIPSDLGIMAAYCTKVYDGFPFPVQKARQFTLEHGRLLPGHRLEVTFRDPGSITVPGTYTNVIEFYRILDENGADVTDLYGSIDIYHGQICIERRPITVATGSAVKREDGTPLECTDYWLAQGALAPGDVLYVELGTTLQSPGSCENSISKIRILHQDDKGNQFDVTPYYDIKEIYGTLTLIPAEGS